MSNKYQEQFNNMKYDQDATLNNNEPFPYIIKDGRQEKNPEYGSWHRKKTLKGLLEFIIVICVCVCLYFLGTLDINILNIVFIIALIVLYYLIRSKWPNDKKFHNIIDNRVCTLITKQQYLNTRISNIENIFGSPSYRLEIGINPDWDEILTKFENAGNIKIWALIEELNNDESIDWTVDIDKSLIGKSYGFIYDYDSISDSTKIWSNQLNRFVTEGRIIGQIFKGQSLGLFPKLKGNLKYEDKEGLLRTLLTRDFIISPTEMGFKIDEPFFPFIMPEDFFAKFPLHDVISLLILIGERSIYGANTSIKTFPEKISKIFERDGIKYKGELPMYTHYYGQSEKKADLYESDWAKKHNIELYLQPVDYHEFKMKYFTISLKLDLYGRYKNF